MRTYHRVLRNIPGGGAPGELVDTSEWRHGHLLVASHHLDPVEQAAVTKAVKCICGRKWLDREYLGVHQRTCETVAGTAPVPTPNPADSEPTPAA
jgi:hypothetical protein